MGNETLFNKIISVVIALILWVYVVNVVNPPSSTTISNVPVQLLNQEVLAASNLAIAGIGEYTVDVILEGARSDIIDINLEDITATADLFGFSKGQNYLIVSVSVPGKITVTEIKSGRIQVYIDERVTVSKPVFLQVDDLVKGYEVGGVTLNPNTIDVTGAKSVVDTVQSILIKTSEDQINTEPSTIKLSGLPIDEQGNEVIGVRMSSTYVDLSASLYKLKVVLLEVPVEGITNNDMELIVKSMPETITIKGSAEALGNVNAIVALPIRIESTGGDVSLPIVPVLPQGIEIAEESVGLIATFSIVDVAQTSFTYGPQDVWIYNVPVGYNVEVLTEEIVVTARGEEAVISVLQYTDLQPAINAVLLTTGEQDVQINTRYAQQLVNVTISPLTVKINVTESDTTVTDAQ